MSKVAPKTLYQLRNVSFVVVSWLGFNKGFHQKLENDKLWAAHRENTRKEIAAQQQAAADELLRQQRLASGSTIPEAIPQELHGLYKSLAKGM